jgi:methyl-accepting chemotaxis protein
MKIGAGFTTALLFLLLVGIVAFITTTRLIGNADLVTHTQKVRDDLSSLLQALTDAETGQRGYLLTSEESYLKPYNDGLAVVNKYLSNLRRDDTRQQDQIDKLQALTQKRLDTLKEVLDAQKGKGPDAVKQLILTGGGKQEMDEIRQVMGGMNKEMDDILHQRADDTASSAQTAEATIIGGTIAAFVILAIIALIVARNISRPLGEITAIAERISVGDLSATIPTGVRQDEVGKLANAFSRMVQSLKGMADTATRIAGGDLQVKVTPQSERDQLGNAFALMVANLQKLIAQMTEGVNVLSTSANQISTSTTQLASSAAQTATAVSEATTTVEEVKQTAQLSSQKSRAVADGAQKTSQISQAGTRATEETIAVINRIRQQMTAVAESMVRLSDQSQTIGQIVATVEDLAAQSNILAVNASIEAAKAGEHGKGFAVVAQEVRSLAEQSKQATKQVRNILTDIQKATGAAVMATEQGAKAVEAGVKQAGEASQSIQLLSNSVMESAQMATQIAASSQQQLVGVDQVATAMESIKQASTQNLTSARQLESAAHSLKELGGRLKAAVEKYGV